MSDIPDISRNNDSNIFTPEPNVEEEEEPQQPQQPQQEQEEYEEPLTLEDKLALQKMTMKINKWKSSFPKLTSGFKIEKDMSYDDLYELEKLIEHHVGCCNGGSMIQSGVYATAAMAEKTSPKIGIYLDGYTKALATNQNFNNILKELECKYGGDTYRSPFVRMATTMTYVGSIIHFNNVNAMANNINQKDNKENVENMSETYKDL